MEMGEIFKVPDSLETGGDVVVGGAKIGLFSVVLRDEHDSLENFDRGRDEEFEVEIVEGGEKLANGFETEWTCRNFDFCYDVAVFFRETIPSSDEGVSEGKCVLSFVFGKFFFRVLFRFEIFVNFSSTFQWVW